jgi:hypothetical protein
LSTTLDSLVSKSEGRLRWDNVRGSIVIYPTETGGLRENSLDVRVSLSLTSVSTWEAIKEVVRQVNLKNPLDRPLRVTPDFLAWVYPPPEGFVDENVITLSLRDVTAREAFCEIFAQSPMIISYGYRNYYFPNGTVGPMARFSLNLLAYKDKGRKQKHGRREMMPPEEMHRWNAEIDALSNLAERKKATTYGPGQ